MDEEKGMTMEEMEEIMQIDRYLEEQVIQEEYQQEIQQHIRTSTC